MTRFGFYLARTLRREAPLATLSMAEADLLTRAEGKSVALVGNARSLADRAEGAVIDAAEIVVRINRAPMPAAVSHGTRTDWLALATSLPSTEMARIDPDLVLWMSPKRKRLPWHVAARAGRFYLHPLSQVASLAARLGAPPTTGAMMIDLLMRSELSRLSLHGFDFFTSLSLSGRRRADQVPHDFAAERAFVEALAARDPRLSPG